MHEIFYLSPRAYVHTSMYTSICLCAYSHLCSHLILSVQKKKKKIEEQIRQKCRCGNNTWSVKLNGQLRISFSWTTSLQYCYRTIRTPWWTEIWFLRMQWIATSHKPRKFQMILQASNGPANWENSTRSKWNNSILRLTLHVPRNISQRRGKCHNPILTLRIFPGFHHANWGNSINARTCWKYPNMLKSVNLRPRFKDMRILTSLTKFDYVWPKFDQSHGLALLEHGWSFIVIWRSIWRPSVW